MLSETNNTASFALQLCLEDLSEVCQHKINVSEKGDKALPASGYSNSDFLFF